MKILKLNNLSITFDNNPVLDNLNYSFEENKVYALMGANGSGKTTLFNIMSGFLQADSGTVLLSEKNITDLKPYEVANLGVSRTFQDMRLIPSLSVYDNILIAIQNKESEKLYNSFLPSNNLKYEKRIGKILKNIHLLEVKNSKAENISYGQQKLLNLAVAIVNDFDVLLLDEPIAGVQPEYRNEILRMIKNLNKTVIVIEHNPEFIEKLTENILFLDGGNIIASGNYKEILSNKRVQEAYL